MRQQWTICGFEVAVEPATHEGGAVFDWSISGDDYSAGGMAEAYDVALQACLAQLMLACKAKE